MNKLIRFIYCLFCLWAIVPFGAIAQQDVTSTYLTNADFETDPTGLATDNTVYDVPGWIETPAPGANSFYKLGSVAYGSIGTSVGTIPNNGSSVTGEGNTSLLAVKLHWSPNSPIHVEQTATLPAGKYSLTFDGFVSQTVANATYVCGVSYGGTNYYASAPATTGTWYSRTVDFTLTMETEVIIRLGYLKTANSGGADSPILFVDNVKLFYTDLNAALTEAKAELSALISLATEALTGGTTEGQNYLNSAINAAQEVYENATEVTEVESAITDLNAALALYHDASLSNITIGGNNLPGFLSTIFDYSYSIAPGSPSPVVAGTATSPCADVSVNEDIITVTAGDGSTTKTYTVTFATNYMFGWDGNGMGTTTDIPSDFGWACSSPVTWVNASNSNDTYAYRYRDNLGSGVGRVLTHPLNNNVFSFPVHLIGGKVYNFTCRNSNFNGTCTTMFGINTSSDATGTMLSSQSKTSTRWGELTTFNFNFAVGETGTYYMVWQTTNGTDRNLATDLLITEAGNVLSITFDTDGGSTVNTQYFGEGESFKVAIPAEPTKTGYIFTGWYTNNTYTAFFDFDTPVTASTMVYAHFVSEETPSYISIALDNDILNLQAAKYTDITVSGNSELHLSSELPLVNSTVNLTSDNSWLYFDAIKPSKVLSDWLSHVKINGQPFNQENDRMAIYGSGTVIIPNGKTVFEAALTVYTEQNFGGDTKSFEINTYHNNLGEFDNNIQSFKLKKGFSAILANNPDGTGFSRVFIASDADIEVSEMPEGMEGFVSFIRVFKWEWTSKKGWSGGLPTQPDHRNISISYDWDAAANTGNMDTEYVPMRHNLGWQSFDIINSRTNVSHLLGYNEPERPDQANMTVASAIAQWPEFFKSGLRLGSPAPSSMPHNWLINFMNICDSLNYRVDFIVTHAYQYQPTSWWDWNIELSARGGRPADQIEQKRPVWITEWNNGANWTNEAWPTLSGPKRDADLNIIYDASGNETIVNKPLSPENSAQSVAKMESILPYFDTVDLLEHHFLYNWVQDARSMELDGKLTPAGKVFAAHKAKVGFKKANEYIHKWKIAPPWIAQSLSENYEGIKLSWYDHNGETGKSYILERKLDTETNYSVIATLIAGTDYEFGTTIDYQDQLAYNAAKYRIKAISYKDTESIYSREIEIKRDASPAIPVLTGEPISSSILEIKWNAADNARSYNLKRSVNAEGPFETILERTTLLIYQDENLELNTTYYYVVTSLNSAGESGNSNVLELKTHALNIPTGVQNPRIAAGDAKVTLTWDFLYDVKYDVLRAETENGTYEIIANDIDDVRYLDKTVTNNKAYYYKVVAHNEAGQSPELQVLTAIPAAGRHLYIGFDETSGTLAEDVWGGYHGTLASATTRQEGQSGQSVNFDGTANAYVSMPTGFISELNDFTIVTWVKMDAISTWMRIFDFGTGTSVNMFLTAQAGVVDGKSIVRYAIRNGVVEEQRISYAYAFPLDTWVHFAVTQSNNKTSLYINGELVGSNMETTLKPSDLGITTQNYIGKSQWNDPILRGTVDEFAIFNYALNKDKIDDIISNGIPTDAPIDPDPPLASRKLQGKSVKIYPNPGSGTVYIDGLEDKTYQYSIVNLVGNKIASGDMNQGRIDIPVHVVTGTYILQVSEGGQVVIRSKVLIQN